MRVCICFWPPIWLNTLVKYLQGAAHKLGRNLALQLAACYALANPS